MTWFSRFGIILILVCLSCDRCRTCNYIIQDLPSAIEVDNNLNPNETIFTFTLLDTQDNNRTVTNQLIVPDETQTDMNEYFTTIRTGNFYITGLALGNKCPPPNTTETFYLTLRSDFSCKYTVHVEVFAAKERVILEQLTKFIEHTADPTPAVCKRGLKIMEVHPFTMNCLACLYECTGKAFALNPASAFGGGGHSVGLPEFDVVPQVEIIIDNQTLDPFTVIPFKLKNQRQCAQFNCSVKVWNSNKAFAIETGSFEVKTTLEYIRFDFTYVLDIICYLPDSAISDKHKAMVRVIFRTNVTNTSPVFRVVSTEFTYEVTKSHLHLSNGATTSLSALTQTALPAVSKTALSALPRTVISTAQRTALSASPRTIISTAPETYLSDVPRNALSAAPRTALSILPRNSLSIPPRAALSVAPKTVVSVVLTPPTSRKVSTGIYSKSFAPKPAHNLLDTPSKMAAVCAGAGFVGLGATGVLIHHASRRCRTPQILSHDGSNDQQVPENSQDVH